MAPDKRLCVFDHTPEEDGATTVVFAWNHVGDGTGVHQDVLLNATLTPDGSLRDFYDNEPLGVEFYKALVSYFVDFDVL